MEPRFDETIKCLKCGCDGKSLVGNDSTITWCAAGHVVVNDHKFDWMMVHDFTEGPIMLGNEGNEGPFVDE